MNSDNTSLTEIRLVVDDVSIEMVRMGQGQPLLWLHSVDGLYPAASFLKELAKHYEVIAPWIPGFGHSERPKEFRTVADLAFFQLALLDHLDLTEVILVGSSFGGWIAAEMAVRSTKRISHLVLANAYGIKVGGRDDRDIADVFAMPQDEINRMAFYDVGNRDRDYSQMTERELFAIARSREAFTYFGWKPYMHNPGLKRWLRRIDVPTLVLWGEGDELIKPEYGKAYAREIPNASFELIERAGHYPHLEQPISMTDSIHQFAARCSDA